MKKTTQRRKTAARPRRSRRSAPAPRSQYMHASWRSPRWSPLVAVAIGVIATIAVGLAVHLGGSMLSPSARDIAGDALWATMMVWWISAIWPLKRA